jgi:hypothetical protein
VTRIHTVPSVQVHSPLPSPSCHTPASRRVACWLLILCCAGCSYGHPKSASESDRARSSYLTYWSVWSRAEAGEAEAQTALPSVTASRQLHRLRTALQNARTARHIAKGDVAHHITSVHAGRLTAFVTDCVDLDARLIYDADSGRRVEQLLDRPSQLARYTLARDSEGWKVTDSAVVGDCSA